jgi:DNA (cytosine-5)-methyltransferase 1
MKCFSMFTGIGGFDLALRRLGHDIVGACEIDPHARSVFKKQFPGVQVHNDATNLHPQSLPHIDVLSAGFPCQAFSIAGRRRGFDDTRGSLFFEIARIAKEKRPSYLLLENVKGLLSHDKGETFRTIISTLDEVGYDAEWQLLNSKYFLPQNRERIFIIGHLRGQRARQIFPLGDFNSESDKPKPKIVGVVNDKGNLREVEQATCLDANYWKGCDNHAQRTMIKAVSIENTGANGRRIKDPGDPQFCLSQNCGVGIQDDTRIRRLTPIECERLQGFPDNWTKYGDDGKLISDTQRYKMCGNAVTVPVIEFIAKNF